jgi:hypothetical protein
VKAETLADAQLRMLPEEATGVAQEPGMREPYVEPALSRIGTVAELTEGSPKIGSLFDGGTNSFIAI